MDDKGGYLNPWSFTLTDEGWHYSTLEGKTTGFTFYKDFKLITAQLKKFQEINEKYKLDKKIHIKYTNLRDIPFINNKSIKKSIMII